MQPRFFYIGLFTLICLGIWLFATRPAFSILEQTPSRMVFRIRPTFAWAVSTFFGGVALLFTIFTLQNAPLTVLNCKHSIPTSSLLPSYQQLTSPNCELVSINWLGKEANRIWEDTYRVNLLLAAGKKIPLTYIYSSGERDKQKLVDHIRKFLGLVCMSQPSQESD